MQRNHGVPPAPHINRLSLVALETTGATTRTLWSTSSLLMSLLLCCWLLMPTGAEADTLDPQVAIEIDHLLEHIRTAPCRFNRNGTWHEADEAAEHIGRKYRYLLRRDRIDSTEDFIRQAATASSISGRAYLVQCRSDTVLKTADWLTGILAELRQHEPP
ncbi:DUF5329 domain-containing protein [Desulfofustis glycolicus]|uniref:DUF5329 domain-containing protein n=1 Tax=Desulfofustis glycolicus DSM 9705 TaxID=1121409 RepID=A0A1M5TR01_9BACT|nr:DUF5329 domain-containing protein [Desulfofustis glycolicus]MCB2216551.1 DUF5329 domain-containing protein [Desulfobulbaceae bacterium]SHH53197.1 hypothetical protein SAMN02745124_00866 [Desulfofustis glycolicus DSM 9705]